MFMADLARAIALPVEVDFMAVASYGTATKTSGIVRIVKDLDADLTGRHVLIVEDIVDSGLTLSYLRKGLLARGPASLEICALLVKQGQQRVQLNIPYVGFEIPPDFVVGYGLDIGERYRNLRRHPHTSTRRSPGERSGRHRFDSRAPPARCTSCSRRRRAGGPRRARSPRPPVSPRCTRSSSPASRGPERHLEVTFPPSTTRW